MRRCRDIAAFDVLGGYIPDMTSRCHRLGRDPVDLCMDSCYFEVTNLCFALSGMWSVYILRVRYKCGIHLGRDKHILLREFR